MSKGVVHTNLGIKDLALDCIAETLAITEAFGEVAEAINTMMKLNNPKVSINLNLPELRCLYYNCYLPSETIWSEESKCKGLY